VTDIRIYKRGACAEADRLTAVEKVNSHMFMFSVRESSAHLFPTLNSHTIYISYVPECELNVLPEGLQHEELHIILRKLEGNETGHALDAISTWEGVVEGYGF
jgi:hypothetical protein